MVERISKQQKQGQLVDDGHCSATENLAALPKHNSFEGLESSEFESPPPPRYRRPQSGSGFGMEYGLDPLK